MKEQLQTIELSIIIPCFNAAAFIKQAVDSVRLQPIENWELLIINDGSTDSTEDICRGFESDARIRVLSIDNSGAGHARNVGIQNAKGKWLLFLDADDLFLSDSINETLLAKLNANFNNIDVIFTSSAMSDMAVKNLIGCFEADKNYFPIPAKEFWTGIYRRSFLLEKDISFFEYKEQDIETAFRYKVVSRTDRIISNDTICFYLQRNNPQSNTHTWKSSTVHYVKAKVYKELLDNDNGSKYSKWLRTVVFDEVISFYKGYIRSDETKTRIIEINQLFSYLRKKYGREFRAELGIRNYLAGFFWYLKANLQWNSRKPSRGFSSQKVPRPTIETESIKENLEVMSRQVRDFLGIEA